MSERQRISRTAPGTPAPEGFDALGARSRGRPDSDPSDFATRWVAYSGGKPAARLSTQCVEDLVDAPGRTGLVGHYESLETEAGVSLLRAACEELAAAGVRRVLGPMNGSTWGRYRLALPPDTGDPVPNAPPFLGEPTNPFEYPSHFEGAGMTVAARYESRIAPVGTPDAMPPKPAHARRLANAGVHIRALDAMRFDDEIRGVFDLSVEAFADNLYYKPIAFSEFRSSYEAIRPILDPSMVLLAEGSGGNLLGYLFGYPDPLSPADARSTRAVAKTVAVSPSARHLGLGAVLLDAFVAAAARRGAGFVIHALMYVRNASMRMSARHASTIFRRYALFEWSP